MTVEPSAPGVRASSARRSGDQPASEASGSRQSVVLAAGNHDQPLADLWTALLRVARPTDDTAVADVSGPGATTPPPPGPQAAEVDGAAEAVRCARRFLGAGYDQLVIVPLAAFGDPGGTSCADELAEAVSTLRRAYPRARIHDAGHAVDGDTARVLGDLVAIPQQVSDARLAGAIARGFGGEPGRLAAFVAVLRQALPAETTIALRGSSVMGRAFRDGAPYDAGGPGSSDLDLVLLGDVAVDLWVPDARLLGGINTLPLNDEAPWVAPALDAPRRQAQALVQRPVSIQAMARWFLDLRVALQGQPYVILADGQP